MNARFGVFTLAVVAVAATAGRSSALHHESRTTAVRGLVFAEYFRGDAWGYPGQVVVMSLAGERLPVPARVRAFPEGMSPDGRLVAHASSAGLRLGALRAGAMKTILAAAYPSFAWAPDGKRLAVSTSPATPPTSLKLFDRSGRVLRSFKLPGGYVAGGLRHSLYFRLISWSGSQLLLQRGEDSGLTTSDAFAVLDTTTGKLRTLVRYDPHDSATVSLSPNGRRLAVSISGHWDGSYELIDVASGRRIIRCRTDAGSGCEQALGTVWAPDSQSLYVSNGRSIIRANPSGHRVTVLAGPPRGPELRPIRAFPGHLVYAAYPQQAFFLLDLGSGRSKEIATARDPWGSELVTILPLAHLP